MATVQIRVDTGPINSFLKRMPGQIPFATSLALNKTAFEVRQHTVKTVWQNAVNSKARGFAARAFRVLPSHKTRLVAAVFADPRRVSPEGIEAIKRVEEGIRHYPFRGRYLAVPTFKALTPTGRIKKSARAALNEADPHSFVLDRGRGPAIWRRNGRGGIDLMFVLKPSVPTPPVFRFAAEAERRARQVWPDKIEEAVRQTVNSEIARARRKRGRFVSRAVRSAVR